MEAFEKGAVCSGVYTIKPDKLPPFDVSNEASIHLLTILILYLSLIASSTFALAIKIQENTILLFTIMSLGW